MGNKAQQPCNGIEESMKLFLTLFVSLIALSAKAEHRAGNPGETSFSCIVKVKYLFTFKADKAADKGTIDYLTDSVWAKDVEAATEKAFVRSGAYHLGSEVRIQFKGSVYELLGADPRSASHFNCKVK